jgi:hypothetical protein
VLILKLDFREGPKGEVPRSRDDVEEAFHEVALAIVEREVALARPLAICPRRNDGLDAADFEMLDVKPSLS